MLLILLIFGWKSKPALRGKCIRTSAFEGRRGERRRKSSYALLSEPPEIHNRPLQTNASLLLFKLVVSRFVRDGSSLPACGQVCTGVSLFSSFVLIHGFSLSSPYFHSKPGEIKYTNLSAHVKHKSTTPLNKNGDITWVHDSFSVWRSRIQSLFCGLEGYALNQFIYISKPLRWLAAKT